MHKKCNGVLLHNPGSINETLLMFSSCGCVALYASNAFDNGSLHGLDENSENIIPNKSGCLN